MFRGSIPYITAVLAAALMLGGGCSVKFKMWRANRNFERGAYDKAIADYRDVAARVPREAQFAVNAKLAAAYLLTGNIRFAETTYERAMQRNPSISDTLYVGLAHSQLASEKYAQALANYDKYLALHPADSLTAALRNYCRQMTDTAAPKHTRYIVSNAKELNSGKDDFAPAYLSDDYSVLAFTSSREEAKGRKRSIITGDKNTDLFSIKQNRYGKWEKAMPLQGKVNNNYDNGVCCFSADFNTMYFTECIAKGRKTGCKLYSAIYDAEAKKWDEVVEIVTGDSTIYNMAHPSISADGTELYFTAECDSCGYGGMDIYKVQRTTSEDGEDAWTAPQNMGSQINTSGNEMYPYVHPNGALYFASNGHKGFGGLDIFKATMQSDRTWKVENMGLPINSGADDFSIIFENEREAGYFASRRRGGRGDDIYRFVLPEALFTFVGTAYHKETNKPMPNVRINMLSNTGESLQLVTEADGRFSFNLRPETDYLLQVRCKGYFNEKTRFTTTGLDDIATLREEFYMQPMDKVIELEDIFYEFGKWDLLPESETSLNNLVEILNDNPTISIAISAHTDMRGSAEFNEELSQKRAQSVVNYLVGKGIAAARLEAIGMGKNQPRAVTPAIADKHKFLREGDILSEEFVEEYVRSAAEREIIDQLNRRTEFVVVE